MSCLHQAGPRRRSSPLLTTQSPAFGSAVWGPLVAMALFACACCGGPELQTDPLPSEDVGQGPQVRPIFVGPDDLEGLGATVLDARDVLAYRQGHIPGAAHAPWTDYVDGMLNGRLKDDVPAMQESLRELGVSADRPVVVYADWNDGWGEEGRLFWMLEYLGHDDVHVLAGGMPRWRAVKGTSEVRAPDVTPGDFTVTLRPEVRATTADVQAVVEGKAPGKVLVLDTRRREEYDGATPYGADRGGHVPGAKHFYWKDVFQKSGQLRAPHDIGAQLSELGVEDDTIVISYCTGGVRSGFMYLVMRWVGHDGARNYDGSWWEWAATESLPIE